MKHFKQQLLAGKTAYGLFLASGSTAITEIAAGCGYDFLVIDGEHGQGDEHAIFEQMARLEAYDAAAIVRLPAFRPEYVKRMLDYGADGILAPMIETREQAWEFGQAMRYPPRGKRGMTGIFRASDYNRRFDDYYAEANDALLAAVQIETAKAVEHVEEIASVDEIDLLFIGHSDLSSDYGCYKQFSDPRILSAEKRVIATAKKYGKAVGMVVRPGMDLTQYQAEGVHFICVGTELSLAQKAFKNTLNKIKE